MMTNTAILTTGRGNITNLLGQNYPYYLNHNSPDSWIDTIKLLYNDDEKYKSITDEMYSRYLAEFSCDHERQKFVEYIDKVYTETNHIAIMVPWCDQGLGIQARNYTRFFPQMYVFSYTPYQRKSVKELQGDVDEWQYDNIYYSPNIREKITDYEILEFVKKYKIRKFIIPETCWGRVFEIAELLERNNIITYAIPNIEIVRRDELYLHRNFSYILANNLQSFDILSSYSFSNVHYIGYAPFHITNYTVLSDQFTFLFVGGLNAFSRKQCLEVCQSFAAVYDKHSHVKLVISIIDNIDQEIYKYKTHRGIDIQLGAKSFDQINELYRKASVAIQVSKHEGLGLGFYDALSQNVPVITLDTDPHREIITDVVGWRIPCRYVGMKDNNDGLIESAIFKNEDLIGIMNRVVENKGEIEDRKRNIPKYLKEIRDKFVSNFSKIF
jgi:glycosyltransferase involved in cell wall biosynthesis